MHGNDRRDRIRAKTYRLELSSLQFHTLVLNILRSSWNLRALLYIGETEIWLGL